MPVVLSFSLFPLPFCFYYVDVRTLPPLPGRMVPFFSYPYRALSPPLSDASFREDLQGSFRLSFWIGTAPPEFAPVIFPPLFQVLFFLQRPPPEIWSCSKFFLPSFSRKTELLPPADSLSWRYWTVALVLFSSGIGVFN